MAQGVELSASDFETGAGRGRIAAACLEVVEDSSNDSRRKAMAELLFIFGENATEQPVGKHREACFASDLAAAPLH